MVTLYLYSFLPLKHKDWSFHLQAFLQEAFAGLLLTLLVDMEAVFYIRLTQTAAPPPLRLCNTMASPLTRCNTALWDTLCSSFTYDKIPENYSSCVHSVVLSSNHLRRLHRCEKSRKGLWDGLWIPLIFKLTFPFSGLGLSRTVFTF